MANEDRNFDELFRDKLSNHEIKPSSLAWERLENKLPKDKKGGYYPFLKIAASITLLLGLGFLGWFISGGLGPEAPKMAEVQENFEKPVEKELPELEKAELEAEKSESNPQEEKGGGAPVQKGPKPEVKQQKEIVKEPKPNELVAETIKIEENSEIESLPEVVLPELDLNQSVAFNEPVESAEEEISYKITIVGKGISDSEPERGGLIDGIENKVEKIGGLLSKVDQGFAELQDAKNNLFASITSKKERSK
ncbi:hypothetical protein ACFSKL_01670 [Belliella marina]|uniref:Anti-sigma factor n=1 Tax=Belliella marina TaxID=1644146 RepID=A0ABW4VFM4_9BACT